MSLCIVWCRSCRSAAWAPAEWVPTTASGGSRRSAIAARCCRRPQSPIRGWYIRPTPIALSSSCESCSDESQGRHHKMLRHRPLRDDGAVDLRGRRRWPVPRSEGESVGRRNAVGGGSDHQLPDGGVVYRGLVPRNRVQNLIYVRILLWQAHTQLTRISSKRTHTPGHRIQPS